MSTFGFFKNLLLSVCMVLTMAACRCEKKETPAPTDSAPSTPPTTSGEHEAPPESAAPTESSNTPVDSSAPADASAPASETDAKQPTDTSGSTYSGSVDATSSDSTSSSDSNRSSETDLAKKATEAKQEAEVAATNAADSLRSGVNKVGESLSKVGESAKDAVTPTEEAGETGSTSSATANSEAASSEAEKEVAAKLETAKEDAVKAEAAKEEAAKAELEAAKAQVEATKAELGQKTAAASAVDLAVLNNQQVRKLQLALKEQGAAIKVDGLVGPQTQAALASFQSKNQLEGEGKLSVATLEKLGLAESEFKQLR